MGLYTKPTFINELKSLFEGKTVLSVENGTGEACIGHFTMTDGTSFRVHGNDLATWIEEAATKDGTCSSLKGLFIDYGHHHYEMYRGYDYGDNPSTLPEVDIDDTYITLLSPNNNIFRVKREKLTNEWERKLVSHSEGKRLIALAAPLGDLWSMAFTNDNCPLELRLK